MAERVQRCLELGGITLLEAGTGTGKTLAYLVPALLAAGRRRVVVSTSTRALQDQIYHRDLPRVLSVLGLEVNTALMKGLPNYVCKRRARDFLDQVDAAPRDPARLLELRRWLAETSSGAIDELSALPEDDPSWSRVTASSERRVGAGCAFFEPCHVSEMKRRAAAADVIVVNHHLFFADLALRGDHPGRAIPDYEAVIFDEAHQIEEVATHHFGVSVSSGRAERLCRDALPLVQRALGTGAERLVVRFQSAIVRLFDGVAASVPASDGRRTLDPELWAGRLSEPWFEVDAALEALSGCISIELVRRDLEPSEDWREPLAAVARRADALREDLARFASPSASHVAWYEPGSRSRGIGSSPIELGPLLQRRLFERVPSVVLTSATLACGAAAWSAPASDAGGLEDDVGLEADVLREAAPRGPFRYVRQRLGLSRDYAVDEGVLASPFRFEEQALLYLPRDLPLPAESGFERGVAERAADLIELSDGGAFVLTTSHRAMQRLHAALERRFTGRLVLVQGSQPKRRLLERFQSAQDAVLVATLGFWQGVDVPGSALRLVVLEKAPFPVPSDPLLEARSRVAAEAGETPFLRLHLPLAQLTLKQGFGRLIRRRSDRGVVALLDARVHRRGYGKRLLEGLPAARRVTELREVAEFWRAAGASESGPGALEAFDPE